MEINYTVSGMIAGAKNGCSSAYAMASNSASALGGYAVTAYHGGMSYGASALNKTIATVQGLWASAKPMMHEGVQMLKTPAGLSTMGLAGSFLLITQAPKAKSNMMRWLLPMTGIACAVLSGTVLGQTGTLTVPSALLR